MTYDLRTEELPLRGVGSTSVLLAGRLSDASLRIVLLPPWNSLPAVGSWAGSELPSDFFGHPESPHFRLLPGWGWVRDSTCCTSHPLGAEILWEAFVTSLSPLPAWKLNDLLARTSRARLSLEELSGRLGWRLVGEGVLGPRSEHYWMGNLYLDRYLNDFYREVASVISALDAEGCAPCHTVMLGEKGRPATEWAGAELRPSPKGDPAWQRHFLIRHGELRADLVSGDSKPCEYELLSGPWNWPRIKTTAPTLLPHLKPVRDPATVYSRLARMIQDPARGLSGEEERPFLAPISELIRGAVRNGS
jgi:hypothetical protein